MIVNADVTVDGTPLNASSTDRDLGVIREYAFKQNEETGRKRDTR